MRLFSDETEQRLRNIPLGKHDYKEIFMRFPEIDGQQISNIILIAGTPGSGKSVTAKQIQVAISTRRAVYGLDWAGRDQYLCYYPNFDGVNISTDMKIAGLKAKYYYYPVFGSRPQREYETIIRPNFTKYDIGHYIRLGISPGAAIYLQNILKRYGPFKDFESLVEFIEFFPLNERQAMYMNKTPFRIKLKHNKFYDPSDKLPSHSKDNLTKILPLLFRLDIFRMDNKEDIDYTELFRSGENMIASYNDLKIGRIEIDYLFSKLETYRDIHPSGNKPFIFIEEAHNIFEDSNIETFVLICRKLSVGLCLIMPEVTTVNDTVLSNIKDKIIFKLKGKGASIIINSIGLQQANIIPYLKLNRFTGEREFLYHNEDYGYCYVVNMPYEAPCGIHREVKPKRDEEE